MEGSHSKIQTPQNWLMESTERNDAMELMSCSSHRIDHPEKRIKSASWSLNLNEDDFIQTSQNNSVGERNKVVKVKDV